MTEVDRHGLKQSVESWLRENDMPPASSILSAGDVAGPVER